MSPAIKWTTKLVGLRWRERSGEVPPISNELASEACDHAGNRCAIITIAWSQAASQEFTSVIHSQVELKAEEPAHRGLAASCVQGKNTMLADPFGITDRKLSRVNEADAGAGPKPAL
jgi:hypothetical protein